MRIFFKIFSKRVSQHDPDILSLIHIVTRLVISIRLRVTSIKTSYSARLRLTEARASNSREETHLKARNKVITSH